MKAPVRVLVVDDSAFLRNVLSRYLAEDAEITVVGSARDGEEALARIAELAPDVVTLDVEMPRVDGLTALDRIMAQHPTPVIMLSSLTQRGASTTVHALMHGAVDFVPKPSNAADIRLVVDELCAKIKATAGGHGGGSAPPATATPSRERVGLNPMQGNDALIVIGASTGGPRALQQVVPALPADLPAGILLVQHMPSGFTRSLAQRLNEQSAVVVQEAAHGDRPARGLALLAPGDMHLRLGPASGVVSTRAVAAGNVRVLLDQGPRRNHVRPSLDVTMISAAQHYGKKVIGVVLTGMGADGLEGARQIKAAGGRIIAEHESTCVVYGMPRAVVEAHLADRVLPLAEIVDALTEMVR